MHQGIEWLPPIVLQLLHMTHLLVSQQWTIATDSSEIVWLRTKWTSSLTHETPSTSMSHPLALERVCLGPGCRDPVPGQALCASWSWRTKKAKAWCYENRFTKTNCSILAWKWHRGTDEGFSWQMEFPRTMKFVYLATKKTILAGTLSSLPVLAEQVTLGERESVKPL